MTGRECKVVLFVVKCDILHKTLLSEYDILQKSHAAQYDFCVALRLLQQFLGYYTQNMITLKLTATTATQR